MRFWEKVERSAKENFNEHNKNEFNPRHVQILLRTYQTGGAAAVLSHTGDPNKGLRDWYENQKHQENDGVDAQVQDEEDGKKTTPGLQKWNSIKEKVHSKAKASQQWQSVRRGIVDGNVLKAGSIRDFKSRTSKVRRRTTVSMKHYVLASNP